MPTLLWRSENNARGPDAPFELYRVADGSLHLTAAGEYGANLTERDMRELRRVLLDPLLELARREDERASGLQHDARG